MKERRSDPKLDMINEFMNDVAKKENEIPTMEDLAGTSLLK